MAIAPVVIEFLAKGMPEVQQAFKSIHDAAIKAERAQQVEADKTTKAVKKAADERAKMQIAAMKKVDGWERQARAAGEREAQRSEKLRIQSEERVAKAKIAAMKAADRLASQARAAGLREVEQFEKLQAAAAKRSERERYSATQDRIARTKQAERDLDSWQRGQQRTAAKAAREQEKADRQAAADSRRRGSALGRVAESVVGATVRGVGAGLGRAGNISMGLANTAAQLGGGFSVADAVMGEKNLRKQAAVLSASTLLTGDSKEHGRKFSTNEVLAKAKAIGIEQAIDPSEVLSGFDEIKKLSGNLEKSMQIAPAVAKIATATGADFSDTSKLAGNILAANPNLSPEQVEAQLRLFTKQGVVGGVEVADFAKYGSRFTAGASYYGGNKERNEATLGAMAQMSRQYGSAGTAAEAALGSLRFSTDVAKKADILKANGIDVRDGKGTIRDAQSIILDMLVKSGGDVTKLSKMGLGDRGVKPLEGAAAIYRNAGGGQQGLDAVKAEFAKYTTGVTKEEIDEANKRVLAEQGFEKSMLELKIAAGEQLLPVFKEMIPALKDLVPAFVDMAKIGIPAFTDLMKTVADFVKENKGLIESIAAHPVGALIAWELTKSFAAAQLPSLLRGLFSGAFTGNGPRPSVPGGGGGPGGGGTPGSPGMGALEGGLITTGIAIAANGYSNYDAGDKRASDLAAAVRSGAMSPDAAQREIAAAQGRLGERHSLGNSALRGIGDFVGGPVAGLYHSYKDSQEQGDVGLASNKELQRAIAEAAAAGVREGVANGLKNNSGSSGAGRSESILMR